MIIESISGNIHDLPGEELEGVHVENVVLPLADLTKRIQRVRSDHGTELGIRLAPGAPDLREGDILLRDERGIVVVRLEPTDVLVIAPATVREMGVVAHNLGNRHLPAQFFGPEEPFPDLEGHDGVMVIQYDHTAEHYLEHLGVRHARMERSMPVPFRHAEHTHCHPRPAVGRARRLAAAAGPAVRLRAAHGRLLPLLRAGDLHLRGCRGR